MLYLNTARDVDKLQKLQNRCLRMCLDVRNPRDISTDNLHQETRINLLDLRRSLQLLNIMHSLKHNNRYKKPGLRHTRNAERYLFDTDIVHLDIYAKSPYFKGVELWNSIPLDIQNIDDGYSFKNNIRRHLGIF